MAEFDQVATNEDIAAIADAIRYAEGSEDDMTIPAMPEKVRALKKTLVEKTITQNGEYLPASDEADGYSKVTVSVGGLPPVEEITDLSGTKWLLNEQLSDLGSQVQYGLAFSIALAGVTYSFSRLIRYNFLSGLYASIGSGGNINGNGVNIYNYNTSQYYSQTDRVVTIAGGSGATNATLVSWFKANATLIGYMPQR